MKSRSHNALGFLLISGIFTLLLLLICLLGNHLPLEKAKGASGNRAYTVVLDAGHGGEDGGASSADGIREKDLNLSLAKTIGTYLEQHGVSVVYTRTEDVLLYDRNVDFKGRKKLLDLAARLKIARETENSVFVSIHMNAFPQKQYHGLQVYYSAHHPLSQALALSVQNKVKEALDPENTRRIKKADSSIYLLDRNEKPAILIECGFLSNDAEARQLADENYQKQLSLIIALSILNTMDNAQWQ
jgi:N-acetylmuramoyl-L-alanine amidase